MCRVSNPEVKAWLVRQEWQTLRAHEQGRWLAANSPGGGDVVAPACDAVPPVTGCFGGEATSAIGCSVTTTSMSVSINRSHVVRGVTVKAYLLS